MLATARLAALATALFAAAALPASADPQRCEALVPLTLEAVQTVLKDGATAPVQVALVDGYARDCPDHGWITLLVSHHVDDIAALATRTYRIAEGRLLLG